MTFLAAVGSQMFLAENIQKGHKDIPITQTSVLIPLATVGTLKQLKKSCCTENSPVFL